MAVARALAKVAVHLPNSSRHPSKTKAVLVALAAAVASSSKVNSKVVSVAAPRPLITIRGIPHRQLVDTVLQMMNRRSNQVREGYSSPQINC